MENSARIVQALRDAARGGNPLSAMSVITIGMEEMSKIKTMPGKEKLRTLEVVLRDIATGMDGIRNTADDILSPDVVESISKIINSGLLEDIVDTILQASRGTYSFGRIIDDIQKTDTAVWWTLLKPIAMTIAGTCLMRCFIR